MPPADPRPAVLHAIGTATAYRTSNTVDVASVVATSATMVTRPVPALLCDPDLYEFARQVEGVSADNTARDLRATIEALAFDGSVDCTEYLFHGNLTLTPTGVDRALDVRHVFTGRNLTTEWFDQFLTPVQYDRLVRHIAGKVRHSRDDSEIRELVHGYVANVCRRDGLRHHILSGSGPTPTSVRSWVWRQALSIFRDEGTDAQTRTFKGSKTDLDRRGETPSDAFQSSGKGSAAVYSVEGGPDGESGTMTSSSGSNGHALVDVVDGSPTHDEVLAHQQALQQGMARLDDAVRSAKPGAADRYSRVLGHLARGMSPAEVAHAENVSPARAATLIAEVRAAGRQRAALDRLRDVVVRYVDSEPMSTVADLVSDLGADREYIRDAVSELVSEGVLVWRKGGSLQVSVSW